MLVFRVIYPLVIYMTLITGFSAVLDGSSLMRTMAAAAAAVPALGIFFWRDEKARGEKQVIRPLTRKDFWYLAVFGIGTCLAVNNIIGISGIGSWFSGYEEAAVRLYTPPLGLQIAATGFLIPAAEEMVFRALGYRRLREQMEFLPAAFWASLMFAVFHGNFLQGLYAFLLGFLIAYVYERCRTILAPYLFHVVVNLVSVMATHAGFPAAGPENMTYMAPFTAVCTGLMVWGFLSIKHNHASEEGLM